MSTFILIRGGGDLASGIALRLHRSGLNVLISELPQPLAVRRMVCFAEAVYAGQVTVEGVTARLVNWDLPSGMIQVQERLDAGEIPVIVDPEAAILKKYPIPIVIDGRLIKQTPAPFPMEIPLHIGLGPGFHAGRNCQAVIETRRGHTLGRVYWNGTTQPDSGQPEGDPRRVLRAPTDGKLIIHAQIGDHLEAGDLVAEVQSSIENRRSNIVSPFKGILRGLIHPGLQVTAGLKVGDVDARDDREACFQVSDKALAIGGSVLEALLSKPEIRVNLW